MIKEIGAEPQPPKTHLRSAGHHWLKVFDINGHNFGIVVAQWNPGVQRWSHSGDVGTGRYLETGYWQYLAPCPMPEI